MHYAAVFVILLTFVFGLGLLARRINVPYPILFIIGGLLVSFVPDLPSLKLDPNFVFFIFLPPLLYIQAFNTSWRDFRFYLRPIMLLAIGLVFATTVAVAYIAHWLIPNFPLAAGFVLGAIISPPDAIAVSAIAQRLGLPRRITTILEGESLVNDSTSLVIFKIALAAAVMPGSPVVGHIWWPGEFLYVSIGGIAAGLAVGALISRVRTRIMNDGAEIVLTVSLLSPYVSYLVADQLLHVSGVLAVVTTGLYIGWESPEVLSSSVRLQALAFWEMVIYLLNGIIFVLIGLQLPGILQGMKEHWWPHPFFYAVVINLVCILVRFFWVFPGAYVPRLLSARIRKIEECPDWRQIVIVGWAGMRGIVSLAAALALNGYPDFPRSHLVQFIAFSVILTTLVFQGLTLPPLIRYLGVGDDGIAAREEHEARVKISEAALAKIAEVRHDEKFPASAVDWIEQFYRQRAVSLHDDLADQLGWSEQRHHHVSLRRLHRSMVSTQRRALVELRRSGLIGDDVLHKIEHELDLEETRLKI